MARACRDDLPDGQSGKFLAGGLDTGFCKKLIESKMRADQSGALVLLQTNYAVISQHPSEKGL
jgi:hypothetical protein